MRPDTLVLHYTGMGSGPMALAWLCNPASSVSCHYFVQEDGETLQLVPEARRAWHAGQSFWAGDTDLNSRSIGIEIVNGGHPAGLPPFPSVQIDAVLALSLDLCRRYAIAPQRVLAHSDIAPRRKIDPGELFPWERLHRAGLGHWVAPAAIVEGPRLGPGASGDAVTRLQAMLAEYGYAIEPTGLFDETTRFAVVAFQRHFRPQQVDGLADVSTTETLRLLLERRPGADR
jgi:N-acetylmuramoyl-L-alanine amidase